MPVSFDIEDDIVFRFAIDETTIPDFVVTRTVDFTNNTKSIEGDVNDLQVYNLMRRCNVDDDGTINAFYGDESYTEDGSNGQVMVYVKKFYYKMTPISLGDNNHKILSASWTIADRQLDDDYKLHPAFYDAEGNEIDYFLYGAFEATGQDGNGNYSTSYNTTSYKLSSIGGNTIKPIANLTRATARTMGTNRGTGWYSVAIYQHSAMQMLFGVEFGFNAQTAVGYGICTGSLHNTGETTGNTTSGTRDNKTTAVNWRGIENFWGNMTSMIDGINIYGKNVYISDTFTFEDDTSSDSTQVAFNLPSTDNSSNWITEFGYDEDMDWIFLPKSTTTNTGHIERQIGDKCFVNRWDNWGICFMGGHFNNADTQAGIAFASYDLSSSFTGADVGARLMYIPQSASPITVTRTVDFTNNTKSIVGDVNNLQAYNLIRRCNVADDGTINAFYGDANYTEDGSNGQVMVYIPKFYYKMRPITLNGVNIRKASWTIADRKLNDSFNLHPAFIAADGVTELDYFLYGAFDGVGQNSQGTYGTSYNTISDKLSSVASSSYNPTGNMTRATARTMAANRGTDWYQIGVKQLMAVQMLMFVEYGFNSQIDIGQGVVSASGTAYAGQTIGNTTSGTQDNKTTPVNWRGIENLWGNIYNWIDGLNLNNKTPYICNTYSFVDDTSTGYTQIGFNLPSNHYITALGYDSNNPWVLLPSEASSSSSPNNALGGDYVDCPSGWHVSPHGGYFAGDTDCGAFTWDCWSTSSTASGAIGARLMYIPQS